MPQIALVDPKFCTHKDGIIYHMVNTDDRASGYLYRNRTEKKDILHCYC